MNYSKLCMNCYWAKCEPGNEEAGKCSHVSTFVESRSIVTGETRKRISSCEVARNGNAPCGSEGFLWRHKDNPPDITPRDTPFVKPGGYPYRIRDKAQREFEKVLAELRLEGTKLKEELGT